jgi:NAD(P)H-dependent flavin oxidoreductase YrpB (nitropropane dioxygenase family)
MTQAIAIPLPLIIQGGMGVGVSDWRLARTVSLLGQLGVVSGTAIDSVVARRLQDGDLGGHVRRALDAFPFREVAEEAMRRFFRPSGRDEGTSYTGVPMFRIGANRFRDLFTVLANFVEVHLAKEGHDGAVGVNYLTKIQMPTLPSLYGAMLAGVDFVLMGAGIPREIPGAIDALSRHEPAHLKLDIDGKADPEADVLSFDPSAVGLTGTEPLKRPRFLPIIASNSLATMMLRRANGRVDGFIIEGPTAGGHNAPPRGKKVYNEKGEPLYGERDVVNLEEIAELGLPFWVAGGTGRPGALEEVRSRGATGIQVGTLFAFCDESGLTEEYRREVVLEALRHSVEVRTDDRASPTGFPFKTVGMARSLSDDAVYAARPRICDLGYLRVPVRLDDGKVEYRCPAEPEADWARKGGDAEATEGRRCLCNALMANIGLGQQRSDGTSEPPLLTSGDQLADLGRFLGGRERYSAADVLDYLLG